MPLISVVIACKNRPEYLAQTLESLKLQNVTDWEAIIVDDYSDEDLKAVVDAADDARFIYVKNDGVAGPSAARNLGNRLATAELIAVADSDDILLPRRLQVALEHFEAHPETDLFYADMYMFKDGTYEMKKNRNFKPYDRDVLYEKDFIPHVTVCYRKSVITRLQYDETMKAAIDYEMLMRFADRDMNFAYSEEPVVLYRRHPDQISTDKERVALQFANAVEVRARHAPYRTNPLPRNG